MEAAYKGAQNADLKMLQQVGCLNAGMFIAGVRAAVFTPGRYPSDDTLKGVMYQGELEKNSGFPVFITFLALYRLDLLDEKHKSRLKCLEGKWSIVPETLQQELAKIPQEEVTKPNVKQLFRTETGKKVVKELNTCLKGMKD